MREGSGASAFPLQPLTVDGAAGWQSCSVGTERHSCGGPQKAGLCHSTHGSGLMPDTYHDAIHSECDNFIYYKSIF